MGIKTLVKRPSVSGLASIVLVISLVCMGYLANIAHAKIYKCNNPNGTTRFSDMPCGENAEEITLKNSNQIKRGNKGAFVCASGVVAVIGNIHYPTLTRVDEAVRQAESQLDSKRYRQAIKRIDPTGDYPDKVTSVWAEGHLAAVDPGFSRGVVVNVKICK